MDKIISKIVALGVPGLILLIAIHVSGYAGAAAITAALATIGPGGMVAGVFFLIGSALCVDVLAKYGFDAIYKGVIKGLYEKGESKETIFEKIDKYPISGDLKMKLKNTINDKEKERQAE